MSSLRRRHSCLALVAWVAGCAAPSEPGALVAGLTPAALIGPQSRLRGAIQPGRVSGGREEFSARGHLGNAQFAEALRRSLAAHAMLGSAQAPMRLDATITDLRQPMIGFDMEVDLRIRYRLTQVATGAVLFDQDIPSRFNAPFGAASPGTERLRLATEGTARDNIAMFLATIVRLERSG